MLKKLSDLLFYTGIFSSLAILFNYNEVYFVVPVLLSITLNIWDGSMSLPFDQKLTKELILEYKEEDDELKELLKFIDIEFFAKAARLMFFILNLLLVSSLVKFILVFFHI